MTHGDKAKAQTAKSSQASAAKKSSSKTGKETLPLKVAPEGSTDGKKAGGDKGSGAAKSAAAGRERGKAGKQQQADDAPAGFSNPAISAAFQRALQKYPNALRKLTD